MKFADVYKQAVFTFLKEQDEQQQLLQTPEGAPAPEPVPVSDEITSELPTEETVDLNEEKYKTLLLAIKKALEASVKDDLEKRKIVSDIDIDANPKAAEELLMSLLNAESAEFPKAQ